MLKAALYVFVVFSLAVAICQIYCNILEPFFTGAPIESVPVCDKCGGQTIPHTDAKGQLDSKWWCEACRKVVHEPVIRSY